MGPRVVTWGSLAGRSSRLAAGLAAEGAGRGRRIGVLSRDPAGFLAAGLEKGDRVGGLLRNGPEYIEVILGCARIGAIFVPLNPLLTASELRALAADAGLSALVTQAGFTAELDPFDELIGPERIYFVQRDLSGLRVAKVGGAPVPEHLLRIYAERGVGLVNAGA